MSTALHEPPRGIRVGRLVKAIAKPPKPKPSPPRAEPPAPRSEEVRLVFFLGLGGAACLLVLALTGLALVPRGNGALEDPAAPGPVAAAFPHPDSAAPEALPAPIPEAPEPELLPEPVAASLTPSPSAFVPPDLTAAQLASLAPLRPELPGAVPD